MGIKPTKEWPMPRPPEPQPLRIAPGALENALREWAKQDQNLSEALDAKRRAETNATNAQKLRDVQEREIAKHVGPNTKKRFVRMGDNVAVIEHFDSGISIKRYLLETVAGG